MSFSARSPGGTPGAVGTPGAGGVGGEACGGKRDSFRGARVDAGGPLVDLLVQDGRIVSAAAGPSSPEGFRLIELCGRIVLPGFIESHIHLDKAFLEERRPNLSGTLQDAIAITFELKRSVTKEDIRERSERALRLLVRHGATRLRAQVEVDPIVGLKGMEATLELREACAGIADIQNAKLAWSRTVEFFKSNLS